MMVASQPQAGLQTEVQASSCQTWIDRPVAAGVHPSSVGFRFLGLLEYVLKDDL